jgi:diguanylate cyclase (GGDEF)-like protein/PAS domain S-box-containing protein
MKLPTQIVAERPRIALAIALVLFPAIFVLRLIAPEAGDGVTFLYVLPVVLVAVAYGATGGVVAAAFAYTLSTAWVLIEDVPVSALGYVVRAVVFLTVGFLVGRFATQLRRLERESARHFDLSLDMISTAGFDGRFKRVNPAFERILGYRCEEIVDRPFLDFVHPEDVEKTEREAAALGEGRETIQFQNRYLDSKGEVHWIEWASVPIPEEDLIYAVARDITERKALEHELERLSQRDPLTGVYNRRRFDEELSARLTDAKRHERGGALLLIDLDRFKRINDELGHAAGDLALREVARVLDENTRGSDAVGRDASGLVARVGGDEFAVLLAEVGPVEAAAVGERLVAALDATDLRVEGTPVPLAVSVGVAPFEGSESPDPERLLALADRAMYVVKAGGGGGSREAAAVEPELGAEPA